MDRQVYDTLVAARAALAQLADRFELQGYWERQQLEAAGTDGAVARIDALLSGVTVVTDSSVGERGCAVCGAKSALSITVCPEHAGIVAAQPVG